MHGRLLGVDEVHGHLRLPVDFETESLHVAQSTGRSADGLGDFLRDGDVFRVAEVDVVRDEEWASADGDGARGGMDALRAEIRLAIRVPADVVAQPLELAASNVGQVLAFGTRGGALVENTKNGIRTDL